MYQWAFRRGPLHQTRGSILFKGRNRSGNFGFGGWERFDGIWWFTGLIWTCCGLWFLLVLQCNRRSWFPYVQALCAACGLDSVTSHPCSWWDCAWASAKILYVAESCSLRTTTQRLAAAVVQQLFWEWLTTRIVTTTPPHLMYPNCWAITLSCDFLK